MEITSKKRRWGVDSRKIPGTEQELSPSWATATWVGAGGPKAGNPCVFPFYYPDCSLMQKAQSCKSNATIHRTLYTKCAGDRADVPWCSTQTHWNNSHIMGQYKQCSTNFTEIGDSLNLASSYFANLWDEGLYNLDLDGSGHCHTYNPGFPSLAGFKGHILLGMYF